MEEFCGSANNLLQKLNTENPKSDVRRNWDNQNTPIHYLVHLTDNPNAPLEKSGMTPIDLAMAHRHDRVAKFLEEYRDQNWILKLVRTRIFKLFKI